MYGTGNAFCSSQDSRVCWPPDTPIRHIPSSPCITFSTRRSSLPPLPRPTPTTNTRPTSLQLLQNLRRIRRIDFKMLLSSLRRTSPSNLLDHVIRIRGADDGDLGGEPLLEGFRDEVAVCGEPAGHGRADVDSLGECGVGGCEGDGAFVDGDVFLCGGGYADLSTTNTIVSNQFPS